LRIRIKTDRASLYQLSECSEFEGIAAMRAFLIACIAAAVIATGAGVTLYQFQESAAAAFSTSGVRI
jgi:hypothetical protein